MKVPDLWVCSVHYRSSFLFTLTPTPAFFGDFDSDVSAVALRTNVRGNTRTHLGTLWAGATISTWCWTFQTPKKWPSISGGRGPDQVQFPLREKVVALISSDKYLGVQLDNKRDWSRKIETGSKNNLSRLRFRRVLRSGVRQFAVLLCETAAGRCSLFWCAAPEFTGSHRLHKRIKMQAASLVSLRTGLGRWLTKQKKNECYHEQWHARTSCLRGASTECTQWQAEPTQT